MLSYAHGACETPLIGRTIGEDLRRTAARHPDREALVVRHQGVRLTYAELDAAVDRRRPRAAGRSASSRGDRVGIWAPNCAEWVLVQYATAQGRRDPRQHQPGLPHRTSSSTRCASRAAGCSSPRDAFKTSDYRAMVAEVRAELPGRSSASCSSAPPTGTSSLAGGDGRDRGRRCASATADAGTSTTRSTSSTRAGTTGFPEGRDAHPPQHPQQRLLRRRAAAATPRRDRVCIPVPFYHCFGMVHGQPRRDHARRLHGHPGAGLRPGGDARRGARRSAAPRSTACRRCSSPSSADPALRASSTCRSLRTGIMAGSPCPVEVMKRVHRRDAHDRGDHLLRHDRDLAGLDPDRAATTRSSAASARSAGSCPHVEVKIVDPATGLTVAARRGRASCAPAATR